MTSVSLHLPPQNYFRLQSIQRLHPPSIKTRTNNTKTMILQSHILKHPTVWQDNTQDDKPAPATTIDILNDNQYIERTSSASAFCHTQENFNDSCYTQANCNDSCQETGHGEGSARKARWFFFPLFPPYNILNE